MVAIVLLDLLLHRSLDFIFLSILGLCLDF